MSAHDHHVQQGTVTQAFDVWGSQRWQGPDGSLNHGGLLLTQVLGVASRISRRKIRRVNVGFSTILPHFMFWKGMVTAGGRNELYKEKHGCALEDSVSERDSRAVFRCENKSQRS